jgi:hypothetical protein
VIAASCRTCGSVKVYIGSTYVATVSLYSWQAQYRRVFPLPARTRTLRGTLTVRSGSSRALRGAY